MALKGMGPVLLAIHQAGRNNAALHGMDKHEGHTGKITNFWSAEDVQEGVQITFEALMANTTPGVRGGLVSLLPHVEVCEWVQEKQDRQCVWNLFIDGSYIKSILDRCPEFKRILTERCLVYLPSRDVKVLDRAIAYIARELALRVAGWDLAIDIRVIELLLTILRCDASGDCPRLIC